MASVQQVAANQANAARSTGPKTTGGKQRAAMNALKHGLASPQVLAITEQERLELEAFIADVYERFSPDGPVEGVLVDRLTSLLWRLRRICRVESELFVVEGTGTNPRLRLGYSFARASGNTNSFDTLSRYERGLHRAFQATLHDLERLQRTRAGEATPVPAALDVTLETEG